jgi:HD superfamily phosphohydrolase
MPDGQAVTQDREDVAKRISTTPAVHSYLDSLAQLDLKNLWLNLTPEKHTRFFHSVGTASIGLLWFESLKSRNHCKDNERVLELPDEVRKTLLANALFYHDYGHLPFSHLLERVLKEVNWQSDEDLIHGSELRVLRDRFKSPEAKSYLNALARIWLPSGIPESKDYDIEIARSRLLQELLMDFISGRYARPWLRCIVNSPIDADKIDYVIRDQQRLSAARLPVLSRLPYDPKHPVRSAWLGDFLADQEVSPHGFICIHGRSAIAAAELLRERVFLYHHIYLAPEVRVFERMAMEIVTQFIIHCVMSPEGTGWAQLTVNAGLKQGGRAYLLEYVDAVDLRSAKRNVVQMVLQMLHNPTRAGFNKEGELMVSIWNALQTTAIWDSKYKDFVNRIWEILLPKMRPVLEIASIWPIDAFMYLVGDPIYVDADAFSEVQEKLRPLTHEFCCDVLIDIVRFPNVLGINDTGYLPFKSAINGKKRPFANFIVPDGRAEKWTWRSRAATPLSHESIAGIERPKAMVLVIDPWGHPRPESAYAYDRIRATCNQMSAL